MIALKIWITITILITFHMFWKEIVGNLKHPLNKICVLLTIGANNMIFLKFNILVVVVTRQQQLEN
jgi:hypothetical protein